VSSCHRHKEQGDERGEAINPDRRRAHLGWIVELITDLRQTIGGPKYPDEEQRGCHFPPIARSARGGTAYTIHPFRELSVLRRADKESEERKEEDIHIQIRHASFLVVAEGWCLPHHLFGEKDDAVAPLVRATRTPNEGKLINAFGDRKILLNDEHARQVLIDWEQAR